MRKTVLAIAAVAAFATPAFAEMDRTTAAAEVGTGAVVGTLAGVGIYNGWFGSTVAGAALPTTVAGSAAVGGVAGVGTVALIDSVIQPCRGFHAVFGVNRDACVNGTYVGYQPAPRRYYYR
ncbi:MAG: hypothetical protein AB7O50_04595 [Pseudolabrys sp.]